MPKKMSVKKILELGDSLMSGRDIAIALSTSRKSVAFVLAKHKSLIWLGIKSKIRRKQKYIINSSLINLGTAMEYAPVNYERVHSELKRAGVNLKLLWNEYLMDCKDTGKLPCGYTKFCEDYHKYIEKNNVTSPIDRKPGIITEID